MRLRFFFVDFFFYQIFFRRIFFVISVDYHFPQIHSSPFCMFSLYLPFGHWAGIHGHTFKHDDTSSDFLEHYPSYNHFETRWAIELLSGSMVDKHNSLSGWTSSLMKSFFKNLRIRQLDQSFSICRAQSLDSHPLYGSTINFYVLEFFDLQLISVWTKPND